MLEPDSVSAVAARIAKSGGFPGVSLHNLRYGHGSQLNAAGVPITETAAKKARRKNTKLSESA